MENNNKNNSNIPRPKFSEDDNFDKPIINQINLDQLVKENKQLHNIVEKYSRILKEFQNKYGDEIYNQIENEINNLESQNEDILYKKKLLETYSILKEYDKKIIDQAEQISFLTEEKARLERDNQSLINENTDLQSKVQKLEKDNEELFNEMQERNKIRESRMKFNKTFPININNNNNNKEEINQEKENIEPGESNYNFNNINNNSNSNMVMMFNTMKENYNNMINKEKIEYKQKLEYAEMIKNLQKENNALKNQNFILNNKYNQAFQEATKLSEDLTSKQGIIDGLEIKIKELKTEQNDKKEDYIALETRKNNETENLINELNDIRVNIDKYQKLNMKLESQNLNYKSENAKLKQDIEVIKIERDNLAKIIDESNILVKNVSEKEKNIKNEIKQYEKKVDDLNLEKNKIEIKLKIKEDQNKKLTEEYSKLLNEKIKYYEKLNNDTKNTYEKLLKNKDFTIKELEANILSYKKEKDKYFYEYNLIQGEYDKLYQQFQNENDIYIRKYEEAQNQLNKLSNESIGHKNDLTIKIETLENQNKMMKNEINTLSKNEKIYDKKIKNLEKNEDELKRINDELKKNNDEYLKNNSMYVKEIDRLQAQFKKRLENIKEINDNKIIHLENMVEKQKKQLSLAEGKALDMVKKQQIITEKYKKELQNAVNHYENIINEKTQENFTTS